MAGSLLIAGAALAVAVPVARWNAKAAVLGSLFAACAACGGGKHYEHRTVLWTDGPLRGDELVDAARIVKARLARVGVPSYVRTLDGDRLVVQTPEPRRNEIRSVISRGTLELYAARDVRNRCDGGGGAPPVLPGYCPHGKPQPALTNADLERSAVRAERDQAKRPVVVARLTRTGTRRLERLTARLARAGRRNGAPEHVLVVFNLVVYDQPAIDYRTHPRGVSGATSIEIPTESMQDARGVAATLSTRPLPAIFEVRD